MPATVNMSGPDYLDFRDRVLAAAIRDRHRKGRRFFNDISASELSPIEKGKAMRAEAAGKCIELLRAAREDLARDQMGPPADSADSAREHLARSVRSIGIGSAYRSHAEERLIWANDCFPKYYRATYGRRMAAQGGPHGEEAVRIMVEYFSPRKAPPGFSNHSNGNAVDFMTIQGGITYTANTSQRVGWRKTWLHAWLLEHANQYGFRPLQSEEWHWDFR
jgi:hypothetical protein